MSIDISMVTGLAWSEGDSPRKCVCSRVTKCLLPNAILSKIPIATGGNTAQRNGARVAQAETSSSHAYSGAYQMPWNVTRCAKLIQEVSSSGTWVHTVAALMPL